MKPVDYAKSLIYEERNLLVTGSVFIDNCSYYIFGMIEKILITNWVVFAVWVSMTEGMIFDKLGNWFDKNLPSDKLKHFVFDCPICMASLYGSLFYWIWYGDSWKEWIVVILACVGLSAIIVKFLKATED